jgi:pyruvate oxidase
MRHSAADASEHRHVAEEGSTYPPAADERAQNVADMIVEQLAAWGVRFVYGIPGGSILPVVDALRRSQDIRYVTVRHESTAAFMASAYGKLTGKLGVCSAIAGAGATNLITGLADAAWDRAPVLAITGQVEQELIGSGVFQEIDQYGLFASLAVYNETLQEPSQVVKAIPEAMRASLIRRGVSHIGIPVNLQREAFVGAVTSMENMIPPPGGPNPEMLTRAVEAIRQSNRPIILAGMEALQARDEIAELSDRLSAPVATTPSAKGLFDEHNPRALGVLGRLGLSCSVEVFEHADLAILIGADITEQRLVPKIPTVQIVTDPLEVADNLQMVAALYGDAKLCTTELLGQIAVRESDSWGGESENVYIGCISLYEREGDSDGRVHPRKIVDALVPMVAADAVIAVDIGDVTYWYTQFFPSTRQRTLISAHLASMGFALPAAMAAQLEYPERQVLCLAGDGGFAMNMADFTTAVMYNLPVKIVLFNNGCYGRVVGEQREAGVCEFAIELVNPDFAAFARSCGGGGIRVEREEDLGDALSYALKSDRPFLVEVMTERNVHPIPTLPHYRHARR